MTVDDTGSEPYMPHRAYSAEKLDELHPSFRAPEAVDANDPLAELEDQLLEHGMKEAKEIMQEAIEHGRRRRVSGGSTRSSAAASLGDPQFLYFRARHDTLAAR